MVHTVLFIDLDINMGLFVDYVLLDCIEVLVFALLWKSFSFKPFNMFKVNYICIMY